MRWEGDTLIVETSQLKEQVDTRYPHGDQAHIVEEYRYSTEPSGKNVITATLTMTDPEFLTGPYTAEKKWQQVPNGRLLTYECTEPTWLDVLDGLYAAQEDETDAAASGGE